MENSKVFHAVAIAQLCHEANRIYCASIGDYSQPAWDDLKEEIQMSAISGVESKLNNLDMTPEEQHANWYEFKKAHGWIYGEIKDLKLKTHPCMVPYSELPPEQKLKDYIFGSVIEMCNNINMLKK